MKKIKELKNYILAFIIPFAIIVSILFFKGVFNNVDNIFVSDLKVQHLVFLNYMKNVMTGNASLFYSFFAGMGNPMISTIIFYCMSPINLLLVLIKDIRFAILFIYIFKISLSGLTMYIFLKNKTEHHNFSTVLFSCCYALSCFVINYFFCIFWFDSLYFAPLVMLGIDKIIKTEKINLLYIISLALAIICNIQMGFGLCVFSLVYYIYSFNINYNVKKDFKKFKQLGLIFVVSSLCAGAISSGALLGFGIDYANISVAREIEVTTTTETSNIGYILKNLFTVGDLTTDYFNNYEPFVYCGLIVTFFAILYFFNKDIDKKKKTWSFLVILVFIISFCIEFLNLFWHLSTPVLLNYRYSCYLGLFLTMIAYENYVLKQKLSKNEIIALSIALLVGLFMIVAFSNEVYIIWSFLFLIIVFTLILLVKNKSKKLEILLFIIVLAEVFTNGYLSIYTLEELPFNQETSSISLKELSSKNKLEDGYRVMYNYSYTEYMNDGLLLNENTSLRYFSSIINGDVLNFFDRNFASIGNNNYALSAYESPLLLSLMGNKYFYLTDELSNSIYNKIDNYEISSYSYLTKKEETKKVYLYENPYALSIGYVINNDVSYEEGMASFDYQNKIIKAFTGSDKDVLLNVDFKLVNDSADCQNTQYASCKLYDITNNTNNVLTYVYTLFDRYSVSDGCKTYLDSFRPLLISSVNRNFALKLEGNFVVDDNYIKMITYDKDNLIDNLKMLQEDMMENIQIDNNVLTGEIDSSKDGILLLTIPYDDKFKIYVDNQEVEYYSVLDNSFIGLDLTVGKHDIKIEYIDKDLKWYLIASGASLAITIILYFVINRIVTKRQLVEKIEQERLEEKRKEKKEKKKKKNKRK